MQLAILILFGVFIAGMVTFVKRASREEPHTTPEVLQGDSAQWVSERSRLTREVERRNGVIQTLQAALRGQERRSAIRIVESGVVSRETVKSDTVFVATTMNAAGQLTTYGYAPDTDSTVLQTRTDWGSVASCDDGFVMEGSRILCNKARLGHLEIYVSPGYLQGVGVQGSAGLTWSPSYRSPHRVQAGMCTDGALFVGAEVGIRVF